MRHAKAPRSVQGWILLAATSIALAASTWAPLRLVAAAQQSATVQRPTDVTIVMSTSRGKYDGTYQLTQRSRICGELKAEENFAGVPIFELDFPDGGDFDINDVSFGSKALVGGMTTTDSFLLSVNLQSTQIGHPAGYTLDTSRPRNRGTAELTVVAGTTRLKVTGINDRGETIDLTAVCKPKP